MEIFATILLIVLLLASWMLILFSLPGIWLMVAASSLYAWPYDFTEGKDLYFILSIVILAALAEGAEQTTLYLRNKKAKVPTDVVVVALICGFLGAIFGVPIPIVGSLIGLVLGIFLGAFGYSYLKTKHIKNSFTLAKSALVSQAFATGIKAIIGAGILMYILFTLFF